MTMSNTSADISGKLPLSKIYELVNKSPQLFEKLDSLKNVQLIRCSHFSQISRESQWKVADDLCRKRSYSNSFSDFDVQHSEHQSQSTMVSQSKYQRLGSVGSLASIGSQNSTSSGYCSQSSSSQLGSQLKSSQLDYYREDFLYQRQEKKLFEFLSDSCLAECVEFAKGEFGERRHYFFHKLLELKKELVRKSEGFLESNKGCTDETKSQIEWELLLLKENLNSNYRFALSGRIPHMIQWRASK